MSVSWTRVYTPYGKWAHLVNDDQRAQYGIATCGRDSPASGWKGTGNQQEYDKAIEMHTCPSCERQVAMKG